MANIKLEKLKAIHKEEEALYAERNEKYGDSFSRTFQKRGPAAVLIRLEDKLSRVDYLLTHGMEGSDGESIIDTLKDLSNYANMAIIELTTQEPVVEKKPNKKGVTTKSKKDRKKKPKESEKEASDDTNSPEITQTPTGPLDNLTRKDLLAILAKLGGTAPKKATRTHLVEAINKYPMSQVAVAITSLPQTDAPETAVEDE